MPWTDRTSGRAAEGYSCNLELIGQYPDHGFASFDTYKNCGYYSDNEGGAIEGDTVVLDFSDPARPVETARLTARAMGNNGESLRVNIARGLLVSDHYNGLGEDEETTRTLAVYDVSKDCRHPQLLADVVMPTAVGHEGCFQPDGMVYYMASLGGGTITPIDLTDPRNPKQLSEPWPWASHGCSISDDGTRGYLALATIGGASGLLVADTSQVQARIADAKPKSVSFVDTPDGQVQQGTIPLTYGGHPYVFDWPEAKGFGTSSVPACSDSGMVSNFAYPRIFDMADEKQPKEVSKLLLEVDLPEHCQAVAGDRTMQTIGTDQGDYFWQAVSTAFLYDSHYCRTDRQHDPTIVGCTSFASGLRVFDIRDPNAPKEIAYYNTGTASATDPTVDFALAPPVIRRDLGQIWYVSLLKGVQVLKFRDGVWPFKDSARCPGDYDHAADHYDLGYAACQAAKQQPVAPAPRPNALISLPGNRRCRAQRTLAIQLGHPTTGALKRVQVFVNGKRVRDERGRRIRSKLILKRLPRGRYTLRVIAETTTGEKTVKRSTFRTCNRA